jgi:GNAT superfamily N-acetyltransferase
VIRPFTDDDADAIADLLAQGPVPEGVTGAAVRHWIASQPERARAGVWVAEEDGIAGWARARLQWATSAEGVAEAWAFVSPRQRGRGLGTALFDTAQEHLRTADARILESWALEEQGARFLRARGFTGVRAQEVLLLDLASADVSGFERLRTASAAAGYELVALAALADRPEALYALDAGTTADVPGTFAEDDVRLDDWIPETLGHPQLTPDGSFVVLAAGKPVAHTLLHVHPEARLAANEMTGTRRDHRRKGLARLVKLAAILWAREHGYDVIRTSCDQDNAGMLGLNRSLGYRQVATETQYLLDDLR